MRIDHPSWDIAIGIGPIRAIGIRTQRWSARPPVVRPRFQLSKKSSKFFFQDEIQIQGLIPTVVQGGITIFAPSDFAWNQEGVNLNNVNNVDNLNSLLLYHAVSGTVLSSDLQNGSIQTIFGENISITLPAGNDLDWDDLPTINNDAYIYIYDEVRRGTTFHGISEVLDQFHPLD